MGVNCISVYVKSEEEHGHSDGNWCPEMNRAYHQMHLRKTFDAEKPMRRADETKLKNHAENSFLTRICSLYLSGAVCSISGLCWGSNSHVPPYLYVNAVIL